MKDTKKKIPSVDQVAMGKIPPQALEFEVAVLGACMLEKNAFMVISKFLRPEHFYKESHEKIMQVIYELSQENIPIDLLSVTERLKKKAELDTVGGVYYISQLTNNVSGAANIEYHARIIQQKWVAREQIRIGSEMINNGFDDTVDIFDGLNEAEKNIYDLNAGLDTKPTINAAAMIAKVTEHVKKAETSGGVVGVTSGIQDLDKVTGGWQKSELIIIAGRPAMGKTGLSLTLAENASKGLPESNIDGIDVAIFSVEMSALQLSLRRVAMVTNYPTNHLVQGKKIVWDTYNRKLKESGIEQNYKYWMDDTPSLALFELRAKARRLKAEHDIQLIIVDYLQLMTLGFDVGKISREREIAMISGGLKSLAKELDIPVIALSQLSRAVETRGGARRPQLSDLRDSGSIEQDADMVIFIHRPEYYGIMEDADGNPTQGVADLIVAKQRQGPVGDVPVKFVHHTTEFKDLEPDSFEDKIEGNWMSQGKMLPPEDINEFDDDKPF